MTANPLVRGPILPIILDGIIRKLDDLERKAIGEEMKDMFTKGQFSLGRGAQNGMQSVREEVK